MSPILLLVVIYELLDCAKSQQVDPRIVGGTTIDIREAPYQISIQIGRSHVCGGALIHPAWVVSAAHCFYANPYAVLYNVRAGANNVNAGGVFVAVKQVIVHEDYTSDDLDHDIALVELSKFLPISDTVKPINVSTKDNYVPDSIAFVSGWGHEKENGTLSQTLMRGEVPITSNVYCKSKYKSLARISDKMVCAGYPKGGVDACQGDSGGPLVQDDRLIGTVSFGMGCGREYPGVYCNVARYVNWIQKNTNFTISGEDYVKSSGVLVVFGLAVTFRLLVWD